MGKGENFLNAMPCHVHPHLVCVPVSLSRLVSSFAYISAADCNIGPPRDGETPRRTTRLPSKPRDPSGLGLFCSTLLQRHVLFNPLLEYFSSLYVTGPEVTTEVGTFLPPLVCGVALQVRSSMHAMQGMAWHAGPPVLSRIFSFPLCFAP